MEILLDVFRATLLTVHLLASALAGAGPMIGCVLRFGPGRREASDERLRRLTLWSCSALGIGLVIGGASLALLWELEDASYRVAVMRLPSDAVAMLAAEWGFTAVLLGVYVATWRRLRRWLWIHTLVGLVAATNLLYHFPTMMVVLGALADDPSLTGENQLTRPVFRALILQPALLWKAAHFWSLSLLVAGGASAVSAVVPLANPEGATDSLQGDPSPTDRRLVACSGWIALAGLVLLMVTGMVALTQADPALQRGVLGGDATATVAFVTAILAACLLAHRLLPVALGEATVESLRRLIFWGLFAVAGMCFAGLRLS